MSRSGSLDCKVYVGDLPRDANEKDLEKAFSYYGPLRSVWVARNPPGFAFVEFEDDRDADDAIRGLDGSSIAGGRVRVERSTGKIRPKPWARRGGPPARDNRRNFDSNDRCYECGERGHYAYDCRSRGGGSRRRSRSRTRSRSRDRYRRKSDSRDRSRSRSRSRRDDSRSKSRD